MPMPDSALLIAALLSGVFGSTHCALMCGGIAAGLNTAATDKHAALRAALRLNLARVLGYTLAGALVAGLGAALWRSLAWREAAVFLRVAIGLLMLLLAWRILFPSRRVPLLSPGLQAVWRLLAPLQRRVSTWPAGLREISLGVLWAFLPCGLSATVLLSAWLVGEAWHGAAVMAAFGIGTLPMMVGISWSGARWMEGLHAGRWIAGSLLAGFGALTVMAPWLAAHFSELHPALAALGCLPSTA